MPRTRTYETRARYRLERAISEQPMASVWLATDTTDGSTVVVKRLEGAALGDGLARQRLKNELAASELVAHPGCATVVDSIFDDREAAIVFSHVPGSTLAEMLRNGPVPDVRTAMLIARDVADVLSATHDVGVVHRDVKPANILIGDDGRTRLLDFGICLLPDSPGTDAVEPRAVELTGAGMAIGTLPYMSPEQLTGLRPTAATDVYSLGVLLYEMLAGHRPFAGTSPAQQLHLQRDLPAPIAAAESASRIALSALDPLPERRPSAAQLGRSLSAWLNGRDEEAAPTEPVAVAPPPMAAALPVVAAHDRRRTMLPAALAAGLAIVFAAGAVAMNSAESGRHTSIAVLAKQEPYSSAASTSTEQLKPRRPEAVVQAQRPVDQPGPQVRPQPDNDAQDDKKDKKDKNHKKDPKPGNGHRPKPGHGHDRG